MVTMSGSATRNIIVFSTTPRLFAAQAGHERRAAGIADRILRVGSIEPHAARRQPIEVRRFHGGVAVAADRVAQVLSTRLELPPPQSGFTFVAFHASHFD